MNIFFHELRSTFKSLLIWSGIVILLVLEGFSEFSAFAGDRAMLAVLDDVPPAMLSGLGLNAFNLTTVTGFFGVMYSYLALMLTIAAVMWGSDIITKEERDKTVEFALALPIRRSQLIAAKAGAAVVNCIALAFVLCGATLANAAKYKPDSEFFGFVAISMLAFFVMQMVFLAVGIFLGSAMRHHKQASAGAVGLLLATFFLSIAVGINDKLSFLTPLTPFKYFDPITLLQESRLDMPYVLLSAGIVIVCMAGAYWAYGKRDMSI